ncbi:uncharacterized protein LOC122263817 [Penaeus japonicus]|uniref:uncharacterized protein LOC122263817 n=1 Tax=Penaeus japonicus TaxID=27405 RepID=UPI001C70ED24|nr:uncharacterized protein LOC122263817 [Penaeus japonicus]
MEDPKTHDPPGEKNEVETQESEVMDVQECDVRGAVVADKGEGAVLTSWTTEDLSKKGDNYLSSVKRVKAQVTVEGREEQLTYVAKVKMLFSETFKEFSNMSFFKEHKFYTELLPELNGVLAEAGLDPLRVPKFYYHSKSGEREVIILEDLTARGFRMADRKKGLDPAHVSLILQELGIFHASSLLLQRKTPGEDLRERHKFLTLDSLNYCDTARKDMAISMTKGIESAAAVAENCRGYESVARWLREMEPRAIDIFEEQSVPRAPFDVVWHGDCWTNNFLFRYSGGGDPTDIVMLDLQSCQKGSPAVDLQVLMSLSVPTRSRRQNLALFLQEYMSSLSATVTAGGFALPFTLEELQQEYIAKTMYGVLMGVTFIPVIVGDAEDAPDFTQVDENMEQFFDERTDQVLDMLKRNPVMKERMCGLFDDCIERGFVPQC